MVCCKFTHSHEVRVQGFYETHMHHQISLKVNAWQRKLDMVRGIQVRDEWGKKTKKKEINNSFVE